MRKKIVAGNWKMNTTIQEGIALVNELQKLIHDGNIGSANVIIAPPFTHLSEIINVTKNSVIKVSAQNCANELKGAFTGEVSVAMLQSIGVSHCLIGHSERRSYYHEDNAMLNKKVKLALQAGITPIFCCGEVLKEREEGKLFEVIKSQISEALFDLSADDYSKIIIAYEPVWAIGTGVTASPAQAQEMHAFIRNLITEKYGKQIADETSLLYGGSCNAANANELFAQADIDGGLIGGASLKAADFYTIITSF
ncbi:MAG: triose-phosphate isomerase [Bacteroidetes bacterium RIFOXYA12_FULL_35_11]|nr:MAG: triose-phosphate isomerase [Bacteroidetes bacterium GWF2_35_48]OFY79288.1 MAG: triose-phosphate isomerase [Bacteroidetes bacterium RIFOXYA12_FULL_35_11]OFY94135.1 MAG: triose-phosphate isomerase [Bacteroidetes bacterium RIFOXYB2_FULL_35_7]OFY95542.1 MAG: triose-phosphate isomerase [Bacteroidetes bacterium RIFOXYC12_FULL_35_7]HBX53327.1 triose-phosphate isomerase [Bacteroidales bacterium]